MVLLSIWFFIWGVCDLLDLKPFRNARCKQLPDGKRKKFRRMESIGMFLMAILVCSIFVVERIWKMDFSWPVLLTFGVVGALIIAYAVYIEKMYFEKLKAEE